MKTALQPNNPFGHHPKGFLWEILRVNRGGRSSHLDYGTHDGSMLKLLSDTAVIGEAIGLDLNADVVARNASRMPANVHLRAVEKNPVIDLPAGSLDSISIIGVLEHIYDQKHVLGQLHRLLKPDGILIAAVPGRHFFSFLDMGNFKFVFPRLHRFYYERWHSREGYRQRYIDCRNGLIGDIEKEKAWHQHFSHAELAQLLSEAGFDVIDRDGFGFFNRPLVNLAYFMPGPLKRLTDRMVRWDARVFSQAEIFVAARKRPVGAAAG